MYLSYASSTQTNVNSFTVTKPSGATTADDTILLFIGPVLVGAVVPAPAGWTATSPASIESNGEVVYTYYAPGDVAVLDFPIDSGVYTAAVVAVGIGGRDTSERVEDFASYGDLQIENETLGSPVVTSTTGADLVRFYAINHPAAGPHPFEAGSGATDRLNLEGDDWTILLTTNDAVVSGDSPVIGRKIEDWVGQYQKRWAITFSLPAGEVVAPGGTVSGGFWF